MGSEFNTNNANRIRGKNVPVPGASEDEKILKYDHDTGAMVWIASGGGGTDLAGTQVDNTITTGDGTDTVQAANATILVPQDLSMTGATPSVQPSVITAAGTDGTDLDIWAGNTTSATASEGGDLNIHGGLATYWPGGGFQTSRVNIYNHYAGDAERLIASFCGYGDQGATSHTTTLYSLNKTDEGLRFLHNSGEIIAGYVNGATFHEKLGFKSNVGLLIKTVLYGAGNDVGYPSTNAFASGYFDETVYIGAASAPDGNRLEISNQLIQQDTSLTTVDGKDLTIKAGNSLDGSTDGGNLDLGPGEAGDTGDDGNVQLGIAAVATDATGGFPCIPGNAGAPTGTPANVTAGMFPLYYDSTNDDIYIYDGAWLKVAVAA